MRIAIGADHAGYDLKNYLYEKIESMGHSIVDAVSYTHLTLPTICSV